MQHTRKRILCVDDHEDSCNMMKVLLEMWNYEVALADTGAAGLRLAQSEHFDMYLLDAWLPEVSGFELCEQICGVPGHASVVFISGAVYESDKQRGPRRVATKIPGGRRASTLKTEPCPQSHHHWSLARPLRSILSR